MQRHALFTVYTLPPNIDEIIHEISDDADLIKSYNGHYRIEISDDKEGYFKLEKYLTDCEFEYSYAEYRTYSSKEIKNAQYFDVNPKWIGESDGLTGDELYDASYAEACANCGFGKKQDSDMKININKLKKYDFMSILPDYIVSQRTRDLIVENNLTGCCFRPIIDSKGKNEPLFYQLIIENVLPNLSSNIRVHIDDRNNCKVCKSDGVYLRSELVYSISSLTNAKDFNLSKEYFGSKAYKSQCLVVSRKVYDLFKANKIKGRPSYEPVRIEDAEVID